MAHSQPCIYTTTEHLSSLLHFSEHSMTSLLCENQQHSSIERYKTPSHNQTHEKYTHRLMPESSLEALPRFLAVVAYTAQITPNVRKMAHASGPAVMPKMVPVPSPAKRSSTCWNQGTACWNVCCRTWRYKSIVNPAGLEFTTVNRSKQHPSTRKEPYLPDIADKIATGTQIQTDLSIQIPIPDQRTSASAGIAANEGMATAAAAAALLIARMLHVTVRTRVSRLRMAQESAPSTAHALDP